MTECGRRQGGQERLRSETWPNSVRPIVGRRSPDRALPPAASQVRKTGFVDSRRILPRLGPAYLQHLASGLGLTPDLVELEPVQLAGLMALVENDPEDRLRVWQLLAGVLDNLGARPGAFYGLASYPENWESTRYPYLAAAAGKGGGVEGSALVLKPLPRQTCARFVHKGPLAALALTLAYIRHTWLPKARVTPAQHWILEGYGRAVPLAAESIREIEIYLPNHRMNSWLDAARAACYNERMSGYPACKACCQ